MAAQSALLYPAFCAECLAHASSPLPAVKVSINPARVIALVPETFMGLSYESSQLAHPGFFSAENRQLVQLFRTLSPTGVLRIGGNTSEFSRWDMGEKDPVLPDAVAEGPDTNGGGAHAFAITPVAVRNLSSFLRATGWKLIYGLNLSGGSTANAVEECSFVARECKDSLIAFQLGNEPEMFHHGSDTKDRWTYEEYVARWRALAAVLQKSFPDIKLAGPDIAYKTEWVGRFADDMKGSVAFLSGHFYPEGPPTDPTATVNYLLDDQTKFDAQVARAARMAATRQIPYRMTEGNSCYNGGKKGVSDTFAAALWAGDFVLRAASVGCIGVNLHGGGNGLYTPIAGSLAEGFTARPEYYGLLMGTDCSGADIVECVVSGAPAAVSCYAIQKGRKVTLFCFNRSQNDISLEVDTGPMSKRNSMSSLWLKAPALAETGNITYGGSSVSGDGIWRGHATELRSGDEGMFPLSMPAYTGLRVELA